jgi:predicted RNA-binding protein with PUA-like domain
MTRLLTGNRQESLATSAHQNNHWMPETMTSKSCWLVKSEPSAYSWQDLARDKRTRWDGVRNFEARNNLRAMKKGDLALYYHSGEGKEIVGIAEVVAESYPDPTASEGDWSTVDLAPLKPLARPVSLAMLKADKALSDLAVVRKPRISVTPVRAGELARILALAQSEL